MGGITPPRPRPRPRGAPERPADGRGAVAGGGTASGPDRDILGAPARRVDSGDAKGARPKPSPLDRRAEVRQEVGDSVAGASAGAVASGADAGAFFGARAFGAWPAAARASSAAIAARR
jgi:hypothetical protein